MAAAGLGRERKVRTPQGSVPDNVRDCIAKRCRTASATENVPPGRASSLVRVKRCGKSAPRRQQWRRQGKPHTEQDQIGGESRSNPASVPARRAKTRG